MTPPASQSPWDSRYAATRSTSRRPGGIRSLFENPRLLAILGFVAVLIIVWAIGARGEDSAPVNDIQQAVLAAELRAGYPDVSVAVDGRTATLTGSVATDADKLAAGAVARSVESVNLVTNDLVTLETSPSGSLQPETNDVAPTSAELDFQASLSTLAAVQPIQFESSDDQLVAGSAVILDAIAAKLAENTSVAIEIQGHTDADGDETENQALSERRAIRVMSELEARGIPADRLTAVGYGETLPVSDNDTQEGKARNRRIEFRIVPSA